MKTVSCVLAVFLLWRRS